MKYVWIVTLAILDVIWWIASIKEFIRAYKAVEVKREVFGEMEDYASACIGAHIFGLWLMSLMMWIGSGIE